MRRTKKIDNALRTKQLLFVLKEIKQIQSNEIFNHITFITNEADMSTFNIIIKPQEGLYKGLDIPFMLKVPDEYPAPGNPIVAKCLEDIYHPNIYSDGKLCLVYDSISNMETGYKETLENLILGVNYIFIHPDNYLQNIMPDIMKKMIQKNIEEYKKRKFNTNKQKIVNEFYSDEYNDSLKKIPNWDTFFPEICYKINKNMRYYIFTLGGKKIMNLEKLETIISQLMRDPRCIFLEGKTLNVNDEIDMAYAGDGRKIVLMKFQRIVYPNNIIFDNVNNKYYSGVDFDNFLDCFKKNCHSSINYYYYIIFNIELVSNYDFEFVIPIRLKNYNNIIDDNVDDNVDDNIDDNIDDDLCDVDDDDNNIDDIDDNNNNRIENKKCQKYIYKYKTLIKSKDKNMKLEQYICSNSTYFSDKKIYITETINPEKRPWFKIRYNIASFGKELTSTFDNAVFKIKPNDPRMPYVMPHSEIWYRGRSNGHENSKLFTGHLRLLNKKELNMISDNNDELILASKYLAESMDETGLCIQDMNFM